MNKTAQCPVFFKCQVTQEPNHIAVGTVAALHHAFIWRKGGHLAVVMAKGIHVSPLEVAGLGPTFPKSHIPFQERKPQFWGFAG